MSVLAETSVCVILNTILGICPDQEVVLKSGSNTASDVARLYFIMEFNFYKLLPITVTISINEKEFGSIKQNNKLIFIICQVIKLFNLYKI